MDLLEDISMSERLLDSTLDNESFSKYSTVDLFTTEIISSYLQEDFNKNSALTVIGSGDQAFNLAFLGVKNINMFDLNVLTYYNFWFKYGMIMAFSHSEFLELNLCASSYISNYCLFKHILEKIKKYIPNEVYKYYYRIINFSYSKGYYNDYKHNGIKPLYKWFFNSDRYDSFKNMYASSKKNYEKTKYNLLTTKFTFTFGDARSIPNQLSNMFDIIILSNIADYLGNENHPLSLTDFMAYIDSFYKLLNENGILINYIYYFGKKHPIKDCLVNRKDISDGMNLVVYPQSYYLKRKKE